MGAEVEVARLFALSLEVENSGALVLGVFFGHHVDVVLLLSSEVHFMLYYKFNIIQLNGQSATHFQSMSTFLQSMNLESKNYENEKKLTRLLTEALDGLDNLLDDGAVALVLILGHIGLHDVPLADESRRDVRVLLVNLEGKLLLEVVQHLNDFFLRLNEHSKEVLLEVLQLVIVKLNVFVLSENTIKTVLFGNSEVNELGAELVDFIHDLICDVVLSKLLLQIDDLVDLADESLAGESQRLLHINLNVEELARKLLLQIYQVLLNTVVSWVNILFARLLNVTVRVLLLLLVGLNQLDAVAFRFNFSFLKLLHAERNDLALFHVLNLHVSLILLGKVFKLAFRGLETIGELGKEANLPLIVSKIVNRILEHVNCVPDLCVLQLLGDSTTITVIFIVSLLVAVLHLLLVLLVSFRSVCGSDKLIVKVLETL